MWCFQFLLSLPGTTVKLQDEQILDIVFSASEVGWDDVEFRQMIEDILNFLEESS